MIDTIIQSAATITAVIIGFTLSEISSNFKRNKDSKERLLLENYKLRQKAYANLYKALNEYESYFRLFINPGNEFSDNENLENFAPLQFFNRFNTKIEDEELWFDAQTNKLINELKEKSNLGCNIALKISLNNSMDLENDIKSLCDSIIKIITLINEHIKDITGMKDLDIKIDSFFKSEKV